MIYTTGTIAINGNTVTGTGTDFSAPLSLIRVGCTLIAVSDPIQIFTITEIKNGTELSVTPAANPAIPAGTKFSILLSDSISVDGLAQDVAETLRYYQSKETEVAEALEWSQNHIGDKIGLGDNYRDCPNISGDPSNYVGFTRILESATGFPSVASGEWCLTGWIAQTNDNGAGVKGYSGVFVGYNTKSLYSYSYSTNSGALWAKQARRDETPYTGLFKPTEFNAPSGAESDKYYPVIIKVPNESNGYMLAEIALTTVSAAGEYVPNCNSLHLWARNGGWTDLGTVAFGHYYSYKQDENGILCVRSSNKGFYQYIAIYVRGAAFPVLLSATVGSTVTIPTSDYKPSEASDAPLFKWGITDANDGINFDEYAIAGNILNFSSGLRGFYCNNEFRTHDGKPYVSSDDDGVLIYDRGIRLHHAQDWNAQIADGVNKFRPLEGAPNSPDPSMTFSGFHVQFASNYATQFAGRNSEFWARTYDNGADGGWKRLATTNTPDQRWSATQKFVESHFCSSDYARTLKIITEGSSQLSAAIKLFGNETRKSVFEFGYIDPSTDTYGNYGFYCQTNTDDSIQFQVNGSVHCTTLNQSSDRDLKDNIQVIGDATEAIRKMNGYTYTLKENGLPYAGVIAQEVMDALPEAVGSFTHYGKELQGPTVDGNELREETRYLNVDYAAVTGLLVQVARETDNRVTELEEENASLRANIAVMDERISKLEALVRQLTGSEE